jgi:hypothetical protein
MDTLIAIGRIIVQILDAEGRIRQAFSKDNLIVTVGKNFLASWLAATSQSTSFMPYLAVGTGTNAPTTGDTALQTELARVADVPTASTNVFQLVGTFNPGIATGAVTEAGLFSASSLGTMFSRVTFAVVNVASGDTLIVTWQITIP